MKEVDLIGRKSDDDWLSMTSLLYDFHTLVETVDGEKMWFIMLYMYYCIIIRLNLRRIFDNDSSYNKSLLALFESLFPQCCSANQKTSEKSNYHNNDSNEKTKLSAW